MKPVYFIAEIGKACNGDIDYCFKLLEECAKAGADAVRFHHFSLEESVYKDVLEKSTERAWSFKLQLPFLEEKLFSDDDYGRILQKCRELNLDFVATPWDQKSLRRFLNLGVKDYKINSINSMNIPLITEVLDNALSTRISTGGMSISEVKKLCEHFNFSHCSVTLLHTALAYPAPLNIINMEAMDLIRQYHPKVGYSANDTRKSSIFLACSLEARTIDRHVHLPDENRTFHKASVSIKQLGEEIAIAREIEGMKKRKLKEESRGEMVNKDLLSKSLVVKCAIPKGTKIQREDVTMQLPAKGVLAKDWFAIGGQTATRDLNEGEYLFTEDLQNFGKKGDQTPKEWKIPGKRGVVVRLKDIDEMTKGRDVDFVEVHYAASDIDKEDQCGQYDLDLVVHLPEYANGILLDLASHDKALREFSIKTIDKVMEKARRLQPHFTRSKGPLKFIVHPGTLTYQHPDPNPAEQYDLFLDSLNRMDCSGLEILVENMTPFAWFLKDDWSPMQGMSNAFLDAEEIAAFLEKNQLSMCLDVCHAKLYCNEANKSLRTFMKTVKKYVKHLHYSDCTGIDGEGLQVGKGEINWGEICEVFSDFEHGWTPEIWNGHLDHGVKFHEAHALLHREFEKHFEREASKEVRSNQYTKIRERMAKL